jgi:hypothetical protein
MTSAASSVSSNPAAEWQNARTLYPLYVALAREFVIDVPACNELAEGMDAPSLQSINAASQWLLNIDGQIQVHQLRQFLQTTSLTGAAALGTLLFHHLGKPERTDSDRDKSDFLLVQFFSQCAPTRLEDTDVTMEYVASLLQPVIGAMGPNVPEWLAPLEAVLIEARNCTSLNTIFNGRIIERGRKIKTSAKDNFFLPVAMVAFTRFSFLMRRTFFRLMHQDLNAILDGLRELERRGVSTLDCRKAQFSADEPIDRLRMICNSWKVMFHAEYSSGQALAMLVDLRSAVDSALEKSGGPLASPAMPIAPKAKAAAAGVAASPVPHHADFEVSASGPAWTPDSGN